MVLIASILGLIFGSFISALVWRLKTQESSKKRTKELSVISGRSMCPHCKHMLSAKDLVPVISWLSLRGKCRYCQKPISWHYPLIELVTALTFGLSFAYWPRELYGILEWVLLGLWLASVVCFIALAVYDAKWMLLPDKIMRPLVALSLLSAVLIAFIDGPHALRDRLLGVAIAFGFFYVLAWISKGKWIGGGDVKFGLVIGLWLGLAKSVVAMLLAFYSAAAVVLPLLVMKKVTKRSKIAFGPFLIGATFFAALFGDHIFDWYKSLIGY